MSKLGLVMVLILLAGSTMAQESSVPNEGIANPTVGTTEHFVLLQADANQAFYVRVDNQVYSSSPRGHLILAQLKDSTYTIVVGFPGQKFPEQRFLLVVHDRDFFLDLRLEGGHWGLYDARGQPLSDVADPLSADRGSLAGVKKDDPFSQMMSAIVRDTAVMYSTYAIGRPDSVAAITTAGDSLRPPPDKLVDSVTMTKLPPDSSSSPIGSSVFHNVVSPDSLGTSPPPGATPSSPTGVRKISEHKSSKSLRLVYADHASPQATDTIDVVIPVDSPDALKQNRNSGDTAHSSKPVATARSRKPLDSIPLARTSTLRQIDSTASTANQPGQPVDSSQATTRQRRRLPDSPFVSTTTGKSVIPYVNSDCHAYATDYDVDKLRVKMLDATGDDNRILAARKVFRTKCFSTKQLRALAEVFPSDPGKFQFLQTAYPFVSDGEFSDLVSLFTDPAYAGKFRTMIGGH
jgi:hypothetical protein